MGSIDKNPFIFPLLFTILILFLMQFEGYPRPDFGQISFLNIIILIPVNILFGGAFGEEIGWRGFLLTNLKHKYSNELSSLIIGFIWALWHLSLFLTNTYTNLVIQYFMIVILISFIFTFLFNRTSRSIWPLVLMHASFNIANLVLGNLYPRTDGILEKDWYFFILLLIIVLAFGLSIRLLAKPRRDTIV